tara:strand:+ start:39 stop:623 length:585 start_codon:yes stop_codon:yes gene_type:complete
MKKNLQLKQTAIIVGIINLFYFFVEFSFAIKVNSVSIFADSIDFLEDASINFIIFFASGLSLVKRARITMFLAFLMIIPGISAIIAVWNQVLNQIPPEPIILSFVGAGALLVNAGCVFLLVKLRKHSGSLAIAAFHSARNDLIANISIIITGYLTAIYFSIWPDIIVGLIITTINTNSAILVFKTAKKEIKFIH